MKMVYNSFRVCLPIFLHLLCFCTVRAAEEQPSRLRAPWAYQQEMSEYLKSLPSTNTLNIIPVCFNPSTSQWQVLIVKEEIIVGGNLSDTNMEPNWTYIKVALRERQAHGWQQAAEDAAIAGLGVLGLTINRSRIDAALKIVIGRKYLTPYYIVNIPFSAETKPQRIYEIILHRNESIKQREMARREQERRSLATVSDDPLVLQHINIEERLQALPNNLSFQAIIGITDVKWVPLDKILDRSIVVNGMLLEILRMNRDQIKAMR